MTKNGKVEIGVTPSIVTGEVSDAIVDGEPVVTGEKPTDPEFKKLAALMETTDGHHKS